MSERRLRGQPAAAGNQVLAPLGIGTAEAVELFHYGLPASRSVPGAGAGEPFVGRQGPVSAPSTRATRSLSACTSLRNSPRSPRSESISPRSESISRRKLAPCASMALRSASPCAFALCKSSGLPPPLGRRRCPVRALMRRRGCRWW